MRLPVVTGSRSIHKSANLFLARTCRLQKRMSVALQRSKSGREQEPRLHGALYGAHSCCSYKFVRPNLEFVRQISRAVRPLFKNKGNRFASGALLQRLARSYATLNAAVPSCERLQDAQRFHTAERCPYRASQVSRAFRCLLFVRSSCDDEWPLRCKY